MIRVTLAIDPGANGGLAWRDSKGIRSAPMPETNRDVYELLKTSFDGGHSASEIEAWVEEVGGYIGGRGAPGSAMFNFGFGAGYLNGCLDSLGIRIVYIRPQAWQKKLGLGTSKGLSKTDWKNKLKQRAQQLFPDQKVTLKTADALLILEASGYTK